MRAAIAAALACAVGAAVAAASGDRALRQVRYAGHEVEVPASWPVYDLSEDPSTCVRFDRHAVYLGHPSPEQRCPAHVVGRSEAILIEPDGSVTASSLRRPGVIRRALEDSNLEAEAASAEAASGPAEPQPARGTAVRSAYHRGLGFDACTAPSKSAMSAWKASPYSAVGVYIGGVNRGCSQPNLTSGWVRRQIENGWALIPTYVGRQAPGTSCNCVTINRSQAKSQGRAAARDAISDARALGLGRGTPIYFDMEYYTRSSSNTRTALRFLAAWTDKLHDRNYVSGVYSSASSGIRDLASRYRSDYKVPDDIWIANWDGRRTTDDPYVPDSYWSNHQRIRQYRGGHTETYRGVSINIDNNYLDGAVAGAADRDADGTPNEFDLCRRFPGPVDNSGCPYPSHVSGGLVDYVNSVEGDRREGDHYTTTGGVGPAYRFQGNLGFLVNQQLPGTVPLYSCDAKRDQFLSRSANCRGAKVLGKVGYAYLRRPAGLPSRAIYRCRLSDSGERTVSYEPDCDDPASTREGRLGFTISVSTLGRYVNSVEGDRREGDHYTTTGGVGPAYRFQGNLGFLVNQQLPGTVPLYSCDAKRDQFLSRDASCEGAKRRGLVGWAYAKPPARTPSSPIYRCSRPDGERFVSTKSTCRRASNENEGRLGYVMRIPLPR